MSNSPDPAEALDWLRGRPNPFDNLVRSHRRDDPFADLDVPTLLHKSRETATAVIDAYRLTEYHAATDLRETRVVTLLGTRGAGKTHLLDALANRTDGKQQLLIRPSYFDAAVPFEDYLLDQLSAVLVTADPIHRGKPFVDIAAQMTRRLLIQAVRALGPTERMFACQRSLLQRWWQLWGGGAALAQRFDRFAATLAEPGGERNLHQLAARHAIPESFLADLLASHVRRHERAEQAESALRRHLYLAMVRATLFNEGDEFSRFLDAEFAQANSRPLFRADRVRHQLHALVEACALVRLPVVFAFDNLEGLVAPQGRLDGKISGAFLDGLAQIVDATRGLLFLLFAEKQLWQDVLKNTNAFAKDRLEQGVPLHARGPVVVVELNPPSEVELRQLVAERVGRQLDGRAMPAQFPFSDDFLNGLAAKKDMGLRALMLNLRGEYSRLVYGKAPAVKVVEPIAPAPRDWGFALEDRWANALSTANLKLEREKSLTVFRGPLHSALAILRGQANPVVVDGWQLTEVQTSVTGEEHPTYSLVSLLDWRAAGTNGDARATRVMVGLLLATGNGMAVDLKAKFSMFHDTRHAADFLVILWRKPGAEDLVEALPEGTRKAWDAGTKRRGAELRQFADDDARRLLAFPDWLEAARTIDDQSVPEEAISDFARRQCQSIWQRLLPPRERTIARAN